MEMQPSGMSRRLERFLTELARACNYNVATLLAGGGGSDFDLSLFQRGSFLFHSIFNSGPFFTVLLSNGQDMTATSMNGTLDICPNSTAMQLLAIRSAISTILHKMWNSSGTAIDPALYVSVLSETIPIVIIKAKEFLTLLKNVWVTQAQWDAMSYYVGDANLKNNMSKYLGTHIKGMLIVPWCFQSYNISASRNISIFMWIEVNYGILQQISAVHVITLGLSADYSVTSNNVTIPFDFTCWSIAVNNPEFVVKYQLDRDPSLYNTVISYGQITLTVELEFMLSPTSHNIPIPPLVVAEQTSSEKSVSDQDDIEFINTCL